jgi:hypothetical protein
MWPSGHAWSADDSAANLPTKTKNGLEMASQKGLDCKNRESDIRHGLPGDAILSRSNSLVNTSAFLSVLTKSNGDFIDCAPHRQERARFRTFAEQARLS